MVYGNHCVCILQIASKWVRLWDVELNDEHPRHEQLLESIFYWHSLRDCLLSPRQEQGVPGNLGIMCLDFAQEHSIQPHQRCLYPSFLPLNQAVTLLVV